MEVKSQSKDNTSHIILDASQDIDSLKCNYYDFPYQRSQMTHNSHSELSHMALQTSVFQARA